MRFHSCVVYQLSYVIKIAEKIKAKNQCVYMKSVRTKTVIKRG
jgi:hypothetical protein